MDELKQVIIVRGDIEMGKGKAAARSATLAVSSYLECLKAHKDVAQEWLEERPEEDSPEGGQRGGADQVLRGVQVQEDTLRAGERCRSHPAPARNEDALGVGPWKSEEIDILTRGLKLL